LDVLLKNIQNTKKKQKIKKEINAKPKEKTIKIWKKRMVAKKNKSQ